MPIEPPTPSAEQLANWWALIDRITQGDRSQVVPWMSPRLLGPWAPTRSLSPTRSTSGVHQRLRGAPPLLSGTAYANDLKFTAELTEAQERPTPVQTEGEGEAKFESDGASVAFELKRKDLSSSAFAAHIHCGGPEEAGPVGVTLFVGAMAPKGKSRAASPRRTRATSVAGRTWPMCWRPWRPAGPTSTSTARNCGEARSGDR